MRKPKYRISAKAVEDLEQIWEFTSKKWSVEQADRYYKLIIDEIEFIAGNRTNEKSNEHIKEGYKVSIAKSHLIFFKRNKDIAEIIRILHQRMDVESKFK